MMVAKFGVCIWQALKGFIKADAMDTGNANILDE